jgi:Protein of unknown function, DUF481
MRNSVFGGDIADMGDHLLCGVLADADNLRARGVEYLSAARRDVHVRPAGRKLTTNRKPDAAGPSGDERIDTGKHRLHNPQHCVILTPVMKGFLPTLLLALPVSAVAGQAPASGQEPTLTQIIASAPQPGDRGVQATAGFSLQDGPTSTKGFSLSFVAAHTFENQNLARFDLDVARAWYKPSPVASFIKVEDNLKVENLYLHFFHKRWAVLGAAYYRRDPVIQLDYRTFVDLGLGVQALNTPRVKLLLGAGYAVGRESRKFRPDAENVGAVGFRDSLVVMLSRTAQLEQSLLYQVDTSGSNEKNYAFSSALAARINQHTSVKIYYQRQFDTLHPVTVPKAQSEFGVGLSISFQRPPGSPVKR